MTLRSTTLSVLAVMTVLAVSARAAGESQQQAESFARKLAQIEQHANTPPPAGAALRRTSVTEDEVNSWFTYRSQGLLPEGLSAPRFTIVGNGKVVGVATVDLDTIAKRRASGGALDPFGYIGGRVPVTVTGVLHTQEGQGRFELQAADVSGVPVPKVLLQELVSYYSRSAERPDGVSLDTPFTLPANIHQIEVGPGQAVVVQ